MIRRSSCVRPFGSFHRDISLLMFISWGIQWFAQAERYLSQAHLYLNGTNWFTSVPPLMIRLSSTRTLRSPASFGDVCGDEFSSDERRLMRVFTGRNPSAPLAETSSSKDSMLIPPPFEKPGIQPFPNKLKASSLLTGLALGVVNRAEICRIRSALGRRCQ